MSEFSSQRQLSLWPHLEDADLAIFSERAARYDYTDPELTRCSLAAVINEHAIELTYRRRRLAGESSGQKDESRWLAEMDLFIKEIIEPQVGPAAIRIFGHAGFKHAVEAATSQYLNSPSTVKVDDSLPFEHRVANALEALGWKVELTNGSESRHVEIIALMRERSLYVHCNYSLSPVTAAIVPKVYNDMMRDCFHHGAIVSNGQFSSGAKRFAACTRTILLHYNDLNQLEERIFGTDTWRTHSPKPQRRAKQAT